MTGDDSAPNKGPSKALFVACTALIVITTLYLLVVFVPVYFGGIYTLNAYQMDAQPEPTWYPIYWGQTYSGSEHGPTYMLAECLFFALPCIAGPLFAGLLISTLVTWRQASTAERRLRVIALVIALTSFAIAWPTLGPAGDWLMQ